MTNQFVGETDQHSDQDGERNQYSDQDGERNRSSDHDDERDQRTHDDCEKNQLPGHDRERDHQSGNFSECGDEDKSDDIPDKEMEESSTVTPNNDQHSNESADNECEVDNDTCSEHTHETRNDLLGEKVIDHDEADDEKEETYQRCQGESFEGMIKKLGAGTSLVGITSASLGTESEKECALAVVEDDVFSLTVQPTIVIPFLGERRSGELFIIIRSVKCNTPSCETILTVHPIRLSLPLAGSFLLFFLLQLIGIAFVVG